MSILIFFVVLFILVLVHEWGHFIVAKKTGMRVDEFGVGFPPKLFGVKKGETEYTLNSLPIGGFVKIYGENYEDALMEVEPDPRGFTSRPRWAQALVLIAGVTMNVLLAWVLFTVTYIVGAPAQVDEAHASPAAQLYVANIAPDSPAQVLPLGSVIKNIESAGVSVDSPSTSEFGDLVGSTAGAEVVVTYEYRNEEGVVTLTPVQGLLTDNPDRYAVGVSLVLVDIVSRPLLQAIGDGFWSTVDGLTAIVTGLFSLLTQAFMGQADFSQVAGPVGIVGMVGDAASIGLTALLTFTAIISLNLAVINLLPFPALDGGRLVFVAIESITQKNIPPEWAGRVNLVGFAILMLLMIVVTYNDIIRLL